MVYPHIQYAGPAHPDQLPAETPEGVRELDSRTSDGIHVRLLWHTDDECVSIAVEDTKSGETFELPVDAGERPLDLFHHPYAYAARLHVSARRPTSARARSSAGAGGR
jgi:hypothetical protein